nr:response regulator transcription factor [Sinomicrobium weinanense]
MVIEDEQKLLNAVQISLEKENYIVETASDFRAAIDKLFVYEYDCVLLDIMLPYGSGLELLDELKKAGKTENVIIISAKDSLEDKLRGLELGADDYLTKPFHLAELTARIKAVLRRNRLEGKNTIEIANTVLDLDNRLLFAGGREVTLNRKEFDILNYFMLNKDRLVSRTALAEHVWGDNIDQADNFDFIYYQIKNLRKKLQKARAEIEIQAVYGVGYKLRAQ